APTTPSAHRSAHHPDPPSFPTRRSSDLESRGFERTHMSNNPHPSDNGRPMPPNYSQASGSQQPYAQHPGDQPYGSQQQGQQSYGSQQYGQQSPGYGPQSYQQGGPQPGYAPHSTAAASAFSPAAGVPVGAPLPEAAYGSGSVGFWTADQTERTTALWSHLAHAATY